MKETLKDRLILEALDFYKIQSLIDDEDIVDYDDDEDNIFDDDDDDDDDDDYGPFDDMFDESEIDFDDEDNENDDSETDLNYDDETLFSDDEEENPNKQGLIRAVRGAYMVFKKLSDDNTYEELWVYNIPNVKKQTKIRNAILSGTDVDPVKLMSPDNSQVAELWTKGNVQFLHITGLPN